MTGTLNNSNVVKNSFQNQSWKQVTLGSVVGLLFCALLILAIALVNRKYLPFKSKQLPYLCVGYVASVCYSLSLLQIFEIVDQTGFWADCNFWFLWMQLVFGCSLTALVLAFRMLRLYFIIVLVKPAQDVWFWLRLLSVYLPTIGLAALSTLFPGRYESSVPIVSENSQDGIPGCTVLPSATWFLYALYLSVLIQIAYLWTLTFLVSRVRSSFNEFKENLILNSIATLLFFLSFGLVITGASFYVWGKVLLVFLGSVYAFIAAVGPLISPFLGFIINREGYLLKFKKGLRDENLPTGLAYSVGDTTSMAMSVNSFSATQKSGYSSYAHGTRTKENSFA